MTALSPLDAVFAAIASFGTLPAEAATCHIAPELATSNRDVASTFINDINVNCHNCHTCHIFEGSGKGPACDQCADAQKRSNASDFAQVHEEKDGAIDLSSRDVASVASVAIAFESVGKFTGHIDQRSGKCGKSGPAPQPNPVPAPPAAPLPAVEPGPWSGGIPDDVARGIGAMFVAPSARDIPDRHWHIIVNDTLALVDSGRVAQAFALGWTAADLFGCDQRTPWHRVDRAGLLLLVDGREISELTASHADLRHRDGSILRFRRAPTDIEPPVALLWHLLPKHICQHVEARP